MLPVAVHLTYNKSNFPNVCIVLIGTSMNEWTPVPRQEICKSRILLTRI